MFTGIVEEIGTIAGINTKRISIKAKEILQDLGDFFRVGRGRQDQGGFPIATQLTGNGVGLAGGGVECEADS